jgi:DNA-directed RNA polymerase sigma subunit (sigma70/sigma32)
MAWQCNRKLNAGPFSTGKSISPVYNLEMREKHDRDVLKRVFTTFLEPFDDAAEAALDDIVVAFYELKEKDFLAISMRLGIGDFFEPHTLEEVAENADCTRERVRQIEQRFLALARQRTLHLERNGQHNKRKL